MIHRASREQERRAKDREAKADLHVLVSWMKLAMGGGLALAFAAGAWATSLQGDVKEVQQKVAVRASADSVLVERMAKLTWAVDSLRIEVAHLTRAMGSAQ